MLQSARVPILVLCVVCLVEGAVCAAGENALSAASPTGARTTAAAPGLDVNDVSILFPHPGKEADLGLLLGVGTELENGIEIWPQVGFESLLAAAASPVDEPVKAVAAGGGGAMMALPGPGMGVPGAGMRDRARWRIVGFRFDPCAHATEGGDCLVQLRLITQPFTKHGDAARDQDVTAHLIYSFDESEAPRLIAALLQLKRPETSGRPLGVHPAMEREGLAGPTAAAAKELLVTELARGRLSHAALMGLERQPEPWIFMAGAFLLDGSFVPLELDFGIERSASQKVGFLVTEGRVVPRMSSGPSTAALLDGGGQSMTEDDARILAMVDSPVHSALLPGSQRSSKNRDCVSCHTTVSSLFKLTGQGTAVADLSKWIAQRERFRAADGLTGYPDPAALIATTWSVRNFGYFNGRPSVSIRTVNESAEAARIANERVGLANPSGLRCSDAELWPCILVNAGQAERGRSCFASHCTGKSR